MGTRSTHRLERAALAVATLLFAFAGSLALTEPAAHGQTARSAPDAAAPFPDPAAGRDPFGDAGALPTPAPGSVDPDPAIGTDPFGARPAAEARPRIAPILPTGVEGAEPRTEPAARDGSENEAPGSGRSPNSADERRPATVFHEERGDRDSDDDLTIRLSHRGSLRLLLLLQPQLAWEFYNTAASPNLAANGALPANVGANATLGRSDGSTTNHGSFRLRRARLGFELTVLSAFGALVELDPNLADRENPASGTMVRQLEMTIHDRSESGLWEAGAGVFYVPFSRDLAEPHGSRIFVERAFGTKSMFPEDADMGVRLRRKFFASGLDVQLAVLNGVTVGEPTFGRAPDLNKTKDVSGRISIDRARFSAGIGGYVGQGQAVDPASLRVQQRPRGALCIDALFRMRLAPFLRETRLSGEVVVARNMDRGLYAPFVATLPTDPNASLPNFDPRSVWVRLEQDIGRVTLGVRYDNYTPDGSELADSRNTIAAAAAHNLTRHARVLLEFDHIMDQVHPSGLPSRMRLTEALSLMGQLRY